MNLHLKEIIRTKLIHALGGVSYPEFAGADHARQIAENQVADARRDVTWLAQNITDWRALPMMSSAVFEDLELRRLDEREKLDAAGEMETTPDPSWYEHSVVELADLRQFDNGEFGCTGVDGSEISISYDSDLDTYQAQVWQRHVYQLDGEDAGVLGEEWNDVASFGYGDHRIRTARELIDPLSPWVRFSPEHIDLLVGLAPPECAEMTAADQVSAQLHVHTLRMNRDGGMEL